MLQPISRPSGLILYLECMKTYVNREERRKHIGRVIGPSPTYIKLSKKQYTFLRLRRFNY